MGENSELVTAEQTAPQPITNRRLLIGMAAVAIVGSIAAALVISARFGVGVLFGGALAFVNYYWLERSLAALIGKAASGENPGFIAARYILRYVAIGVVLAIVYISNAVPVIAVILGLASFAFAVVVEGSIRIFSNSSKRDF